jgi:hypothetical protein
MNIITNQEVARPNPKTSKSATTQRMKNTE